MKLWVDTTESLRIALGAVAANKARGALTTLGIVIGIVAVTMTLAASRGMEQSFRQAAGSVGADVVYVSRRPWIMMNDWFLYRNRPNISVDDADDLAAALEGRAIVNPSMGTRRSVKFRSETLEDMTIIGTTEKMPLMSGNLPAEGRFLLPFDVRFKKQVAIIGADVATGLFDGVDPIDRTINIGSYRYRVIGVMEKVGGSTFGGPNLDLQIFIPISSYVKSFGGRRSMDVDVAVKGYGVADLENLEYTVIGEMRKIRGLRPTEDDNFSINKLDSLMGAFNSIFGAIMGIGLLITSISLIVGGIGVMNIMFVSVTERTREIGIRKAIGAHRRSIMMQFLFESAFICLLGGVLGIGLSMLLVVAINSTGAFTASLSPGIMISALAVAAMVGIFAGLVPAWKGARYAPIEALRYE